MDRSWGILGLVVGGLLVLYFGAIYDIDDLPSSAYHRITGSDMYGNERTIEVIGTGARGSARDARRSTKSLGTVIGVIACVAGALVLWAPRGGAPRGSPHVLVRCPTCSALARPTVTEGVWLCDSMHTFRHDPAKEHERGAVG